MDNRPPNLLAKEKSPYLLQHQFNPVQWRPWGPAAFEAAKAQDKPIFLSIGYSTCYWCHVMERDSFERDDVAAVLNRDFICIKVDREERPDVDQIYMDVVVGLTGHGGWPMSVFLTPEGKPFWGGTFFWRAQFLRILEGLSKAWNTDRSTVVGSA
ncbi:MAG: thioredoxin domain-containing protein, partial [Proteobacteria bacterium]|nr:thioredoxin domain-containing protein [Pseudomonadota bacterium]